nr:DnaJ homolog subfamily C GRV2 [Tanacetum cinerariifolium]
MPVMDYLPLLVVHLELVILRRTSFHILLLRLQQTIIWAHNLDFQHDLPMQDHVENLGYVTKLLSVVALEARCETMSSDELPIPNAPLEGEDNPSQASQTPQEKIITVEAQDKIIECCDG